MIVSPDGTILTPDDTPIIFISCDAISTWGLSVWLTSQTLRTDYDFDPIAALQTVDRKVIVRFDSEKPEVQRWEGGDARGLRDSVQLLSRGDERYSPWTFLERLATGVHQRLAMRIVNRDIVWTAIFDISKGTPVAQEVLALCPESD